MPPTTQRCYSSTQHRDTIHEGEHSERKFTTMSNRSAAVARQGAPFAGQHAVVIGGSIAGLLAGRVLADHFADVTIIERDAFAETAEARKGVPQGRHVHGLLNQG